MVASISVVLPVAGLVLCLVGGGRLVRGHSEGWILLGCGIGAIALDMLIDFVWAHPGVTASDQPDLNQRGAQLTGRTAIVSEAIADGRGKVKVGDTVWPAAGPDMPAGGAVRIVSASTAVLLVEASRDGDL
jgi:membrane protein implicated in regulation of membrane protease activity